MKQIDDIKKKFNNTSDLTIKKVKNVYILFLNSLINLSSINEFVIKNILNNTFDITSNLGPNGKVIKKDEIEFYLLNGFTVIIGKNIYAIETRGNLIRSVSEPTVETDPYGPKDSLTESIETNLGLIKRRIKSPNLINIDLSLGTITLNATSILYLKDITDINLVNKIHKKMKNINKDSVISIGNLKNLIIDETRTVLPTVMESERPDVICNALLEGKVAIIMDNSPSALILPTFFTDYVNPLVDNYIKSSNINFIKIIRYLSLLITLFLPALYIGLINYNIETIPISLLTSFAKQIQNIPFPTGIEALIMLFIGSILRESDIRFPSTYGSSVSIVGALILGTTASEAGLISPIMIIVVALTFITSMIFTDTELVNGLRIYRFIFMILAIFFGLYGLFLGIIIFLIHLSDIKVLGKPYTYPLSPFDKIYLFKTLFKGKTRKDDKKAKMLVRSKV